MGAAGLWATWKDDQGMVLHSFTLLTINANAHPLMNQMHKPADEKRMIVILPPERYDDWLQASAQDSADFLRPIAADQLIAQTPTSAQSSLGL
jgi:putative SOS response-associated peptidase YedK